MNFLIVQFQYIFSRTSNFVCYFINVQFIGLPVFWFIVTCVCAPRISRSRKKKIKHWCIMLALVPSLARSHTLFVIALTSHHTCPWPRPLTHSLLCLWLQSPSCLSFPLRSLILLVIALTIMYARSRPLTQSLVLALTITHSHSVLAITLTMMFAFALSLTHSVYDCTRHDVYLPSLCHSLAITLVITSMFVLAQLPPFFTSTPQSLILLHTHSPACTSSPSHQLTRFVTTRMIDLLPLIHSQLCLWLYSPSCLPSPSHWLTHSTILMIALTIVYTCPHPLAYTL